MSRWRPSARKLSVENLQHRQNLAELFRRLRALHVADVAYVLEALPLDDRRTVWEQLDPERAGLVFVEVSDAVRESLVDFTPREELIRLLTTLDPEDLGHVSESITDDVLDEVARALDSGNRSAFQQAILYTHNQVGHHMTREWVAVPETHSVDEALADLRARGSLPPQTDRVFVVDARLVLRGAIPLQALLLNDPGTPLTSAIVDDTVTLKPDGSAADEQPHYCLPHTVQEQEARMQRGLMLGDLVQDFRICLRGLLRAPLMTMTIVATVGLGLGATTVIFSVVHAALLRPLPYAEPDRLVRIYTDAPPNRFRFSVADYLALQAQQTHFDQISAYTDREMAYSDGTVADRLRGRVVSPSYFALLGITPALGRDFAELDGRPGSPPAVIVSHGFWQRRLGGRADVIGGPIRLDGSDYALAGVLAQTVGPLEQGQEFFVAGQWDTPQRKGPFFLTVLGRLRHGAERSFAADELRAINRQLFPVWRASYQDEKATWSMMDLKAHVTGDVGTIAGLALTAVGLVWLIACTNASNLLIARVTSRRRELAVRAALGASRTRVVRYLLAESSLLAIAAAAVGIALTLAGVALWRSLGAGYFPRTQEITIAGPVLWLLAALTAASAVLFGLVPAVHGTGGPVDESLRSMGRSSTGSVAVKRLRRVLVASQFAIATPLLVVAGLLMASLNELGRVDLGFDTHNLLSGSIALPAAQYSEPGRVALFWDEIQRRVEALPGVSGVAFADGRPPNNVNNFNNFDLEDFPTPPGQSQPVTPWVSVTPEYFRLLGLTLLQGRVFDEREGNLPDVEVVVVDAAWARRFFPNVSAVGKRFREGGCTSCPWTTVVGVVSDVKYAGLDKPDQGSVYTPMAGRGLSQPIEQATSRFRYVILRTGTDPMTVLPAVTHVVRELDPSLPFSNVATMEELVARSLQRPRSLSLLVGGFAVVALLLSIVGIYGVMAYYVQQHSKDISIRLALGGSSADVLRLIVGQGMAVVASGIVVGLLTALVLTRLMSTLLFGVRAADAFTFVAVSMLLLAVALVACFVPDMRATGLQPAAVLRNE